MTTALKSCQAALALLGLLIGVAAQATDVAELPLKTSVLAKPNVIFALDDSGSMDAEVMIDGNFQGWFYGSADSKTFDPLAAPRTGAVSANDAAMFYLFPNGTGTGNRVYGDPGSSANSGYGIPPTPELAWTRSPSYNTLYYDTQRTYTPWAPAYVGGASRTYANANPSAAQSHPALGSTAMNLTANLFSTTTDWRFTFTPGMTIPAGATSLTCNGTVPTVGASGVKLTTTNKFCRAAVSYYLPTFWNRETCTVNGSTCVATWDGFTLKRYEIKSGNSFPSNRSYADEIQNFANWFSYHRKRRMMLAGAMGKVLENLSGLRLGVVNFNARTAPTMYDADAGSSANNRLAVSGIFYVAEGNQSTPTHATMAYIRDQFDTNTSIIQYACQRNASFVITDGFANDSASAPPAYSQSTYGAGAPYQTTTASSLADKALSYFTNRLRATGASPLPAGRVPLGRSGVANPDTNPNLHLQTYALTLGMKGTVWPSAVDPFVSAPSWPVPVANTATMIDDLWHATINGRGQMYLASDSAATSAGIAAGLSDIIDQIGAQSSLAVSSINLERGDARVYLGTYNPAGWTGNLTANAISASTGEISSTTSWNADALLRARAWSGRVVASQIGNSGVAFTAANVGAAVNPGGVWGSNAAVVDYLRGSRAGEGVGFRSRVSLMAAVINAEPVVSRDDKMIFLASGEGMLHAFDADTGAEHWAYVPPQALANLGQISSRDYAFRTKLDATPAWGKLAGNGKRVLVGALGGAARGYYALDVSSPRNKTEDQLASAAMWQFPAVGDATNLSKMGYSFGRPVIAKTSTQGDVVLVTSGYDNAQVIGDGKGRLWMLNANTGVVLRQFVTPDGSNAAEAGLTHVSAYRETDGTVRHVYGGDLLGNLWRFDLDTGVTLKLAVLKDAAGNLQPITSAPELVTLADQRIVLLGTGRLLDITDFGNSRTQSFYAITDGATLSNARSALIHQTYTRGASPELSGATVNWATDRGWYFDLPAGEQVNTSPSVAYGAVGFSTNANGGSDCTQSANMYLVDIGSGQKSPIADFASAQISTAANASRLTLLRLSNGRLVGTSHTSDGTVFRRSLGTLALIQPAKNAWREIRR